MLFPIISPTTPAVINAVNFDGSTAVANGTGALTGVSNSKLLMCSFWLKTSITSQGTILDTRSDDSDIETVDTAGTLHVKFPSAVSGEALEFTTSTAVNSGSWVHVLFAVDLANTSNRWVYIDDTLDSSVTWTNYSNEVMNFSVTGWAIGGRARFSGTPIPEYTGDLYDFWFGTGEWLDLSTTSNRRKFIDASGNPVFLGATGGVPTGSAPIMFFSGPTASWHENKGTGGTFTKIGTLTTASTSPSD